MLRNLPGLTQAVNQSVSDYISYLWLRNKSPQDLVA